VTEVEKTQMVVKSGDNYSYNKKLQPLAKELRKGLTKSEACLWKYAMNLPAASCGVSQGW